MNLSYGVSLICISGLGDQAGRRGEWKQEGTCRLGKWREVESGGHDEVKD